MKKIILGLVALCASAMSAYSEPELEVSVHSRHMWRGQVGPDAVSIQPEISYPIGSAGTSINLWSQIPIQGNDTEHNFTVSQEIGEIGTLSATSYYFSGPLLAADSHDLEISFTASYAGIDLLVGRFLHGDEVKDDTWIGISYDVKEFEVFAGVGDGAYMKNDDSMGLVAIGASMETEGGYGGSFIYNVDTETPLLVARKAW